MFLLHILIMPYWSWAMEDANAETDINIELSQTHILMSFTNK